MLLVGSLSTSPGQAAVDWGRVRARGVGRAFRFRTGDFLRSRVSVSFERLSGPNAPVPAPDEPPFAS